MTTVKADTYQKWP
ncbi:Protein of unknown function [Streptococcus thermophilus]|nr:Protein of unknown function [Streptococcus thermophilus]